ncbi:protein preli-like [Cimex lectularius]|uniref:PRELI/MSF1 domain-containing protein n=1 Tax=Cimex lectularius TaxID=79782 RepID=A0A8I6S3Q8_CIMLE|nr:protein preli-like [Cimex lectularius]
MVRYYESKTVFQFTWDQVVQGFWRRYPNPESKHVLSEDTIHREVKGNKLFTKRLLTKTNRVPKWGERFVGTPIVKVIEESVVDPKEKVLTTYTKNLGYTKVMSVVEKVTYRVSEENPNWTIAERSAWVDSQVLGFGRAIQAFGVERLKKNCVKMVRGFNYVLSSMFPPSIQPHAPMTNAEKLRDAAKKASELAKAKAETLYAKCEPSV